VRLHRLALRKLDIEKPEPRGADDFCYMPPVGSPVFTPGKHCLPVFSLPKQAKLPGGQSEAGQRPAPDFADGQDAGFSSRSSFFGSSAGRLGLDCRM
jgi:hypothetical protein